ncbi:MAG: hypothetical protein AAFQ94_03415 [Bacteroidota bacterium]
MNITIITILFSLLLSPVLYGQNGEMKLVQTADQNVYKLYFSSDIASDVKVSVRNQAKKTVFTRKIKDKKGFILPIDFSEFTSDTYSVELFSPLFVLYDTIAYQSATDRFISNFEWEVVENKNKVIVTALKPMSDEVTVLIKDNNNNEIDKQQIPGNRFGVRVFNFDGINSDVIYVSFYYKGEVVISKEFPIQ